MGILTDIAAQTDTPEMSVTIGPDTVNPVIGADIRRYAIGFSWSVGGGQVITTNPDPASASGFIPPATGIQWFLAKDQGSLAQKQWYARGAGLGNILTVWVVLLTKDA